jgi:hypothetical protein
MIKNLRAFYVNYKKAVETFASSMQKATVQFDKDFLRQFQDSANSNADPQMIDSLT